MALHIKHYPSSQYSLLLNTLSGFMVRLGKHDIDPPYNSETPELLDISITNYCELGCDYCYRKSNRSGNHMLFSNYHKLIKQASEAGVVQVALGGGNPNQHPDFINILKMTRQYGIIPSYSTNGIGITNEVIEATKKYCGAVAISHHNNMTDIIATAKRFISMGVKTNLHFILDAQTVYQATEIMGKLPEYWNVFNAIIFLNLKPTNNETIYHLKNANPEILNQFFNLTKQEYSYKIGFDSCMISFLMHQGYNCASKCLESCEAAKFSAFVSEDMEMYPCSFMINAISGSNLNGMALKDIWAKDSNFIKTRHRPCECLCEHSNTCFGGCPIFDINDISCRTISKTQCI